jgi:uncharacterized lipoprotein YbaY
MEKKTISGYIFCEKLGKIPDGSVVFLYATNSNDKVIGVKKLSNITQFPFEYRIEMRLSGKSRYQIRAVIERESNILFINSKEVDIKLNEANETHILMKQISTLKS